MDFFRLNRSLPVVLDNRAIDRYFNDNLNGEYLNLVKFIDQNI